MEEFLCDEKENLLDNSLSSDQINQITNFINENIKKEQEKSKSLKCFKKLIEFLKQNNIKLGFIDADAIYNACPQLANMFDSIFDEVTLFNDENIQLLLTLYNNNKAATDSFDESSDEALFSNRFNNNDIDLLKLYFNEIKNYELLTYEQEVEICKRIEQGDKEAVNELVNHNLRLVANAAKSLVGHGLTYSDLIQEGNLGLMVAANKFSLSRKCRFSTYAMWWIRQKMLRAIPDTGLTIRIPVHMYSVIFKIRREKSIYSDTHNGETPSVEYLSEVLNETVDKVKYAIKVDSPVVSLETPIGDEDDSQLGDFIEDESIDPCNAENNIYYEEFRKALEQSTRLNNKEREVLKYRYGFYNNRLYTLEEIGKIMCVTRERIRQVEAKALRKLAIDTTIKKFAPDGFHATAPTTRPYNKQSALNTKYYNEKKERQDEYNESYSYIKPLTLTKKDVAIA